MAPSNSNHPSNVQSFEFRSGFLKINHSTLEIPSRPVVNAESIEVVRSIASRFLDCPIDPQVVEVGPVSSNSVNYLVRSWAGKEVLLRRCDSQSDEEYLTATADLIAGAREFGAPLAKQIKSLDHNCAWVVRDDHKSWIAFEYIPALTYFSGAGDQLERAGAAIALMHHGLNESVKRFPHIEQAQKAVTRHTSLSNTDLDRYLTRADTDYPRSLNTRFLCGEASLLRMALQIHSDLGSKMEATQNQGLIHFDLHPHNFLDSQVGIMIVDYDGIHRANLMSDVGFALHRLGRQALFHNFELKPNEAVEKFLSGYTSRLNRGELNVPELMYFGLDRGLQSVKSVLDKFYISRDESYSELLPKFILAAREILFLFKRSPLLARHIDPSILASLPNTPTPAVCQGT